MCHNICVACCVHSVCRYFYAVFEGQSMALMSFVCHHHLQVLIFEKPSHSVAAHDASQSFAGIRLPQRRPSCIMSQYSIIPTSIIQPCEGHQEHIFHQTMNSAWCYEDTSFLTRSRAIWQPCLRQDRAVGAVKPHHDKCSPLEIRIDVTVTSPRSTYPNRMVSSVQSTPQQVSLKELTCSLGEDKGASVGVSLGVPLRTRFHRAQCMNSVSCATPNCSQCTRPEPILKGGRRPRFGMCMWNKITNLHSEQKQWRELRVFT